MNAKKMSFWLIVVMATIAFSRQPKAVVYAGLTPTPTATAEPTSIPTDEPTSTPTNTPEPTSTEAPPTEVPPTEAPPTAVSGGGAPETAIAAPTATATPIPTPEAIPQLGSGPGPVGTVATGTALLLVTAVLALSWWRAWGAYRREA